MLDPVPLFIPLAAKWYEAFERGEKTEEFRKAGPRWNAKSCRVGRPVILSYGYGVKRRVHGVITSFRIVGPDHHPAIREVWPDAGEDIAAIGITLNRKEPRMQHAQNSNEEALKKRRTALLGKIKRRKDSIDRLRGNLDDLERDLRRADRELAELQNKG